MKARAVIKYGAIAVLLAIAGILTAIGAMTIIFSPEGESFAPKDSADLAAWIQAIGSIAAIYCAFRLGERQAASAHKSAIDQIEHERKLRHDSYMPLIGLLVQQVRNLVEFTMNASLAEFRGEWEHRFKANCEDTIAAFNTIPIHDIGGAVRLVYALRIKSTISEIVACCSQLADDTTLTQSDFRPSAQARLSAALDTLNGAMTAIAADFQKQNASK